MTKENTITAVKKAYQDFAGYISRLSDEDLRYTPQGRWSAQQQLLHIVLCIKPLAIVFSMNKEDIAAKFGTSNRSSVTPEQLYASYIEKLGGAGIAPERFVPGNSPQDRDALIAEMNTLVDVFSAKANTFSEEQLDDLLIPHPLLGTLTLREMLYNCTDHVKHHQESVRKQLAAVAS